MRNTWTVIAIVAVAAACPPHEDDFTPQIPVVPGAAAKGLHLMGKDKDAPSKDAGVSVKRARVKVMAATDVLGGPNAIGRAGDVLLENDEVAFVIGQIGSSAGFAESGGNIVDAADAIERRDELGQMFTYFGTFPRQGVYETLETGSLADGSAWVVAKGHELYESKLAVLTRYVLTATDRAVLLTTTLTNEGPTPVGGLTPGDALQWGGVEKFSPDRGKNFKGISSGAFLGGVGRYASYAVASTGGDIDAISGPAWSDTIQGRSVAIQPGKTMQYARIFLVGPRADTAGLVTELMGAAGEAVGTVSLTLSDASGAAVRVPEGGRVEVSNDADVVVMDLRASHEADALVGDLPPGKWTLEYAGGGGRSGASKLQVEVAKDKVTSGKLTVSPAGKLKLQCTELVVHEDGRQDRHLVPCKATLEGLNGTRTPDFGPAHAAGPAKNQITSVAEAMAVDLAPGRYRITLSRGPEYALVQFEQDVAPNAVTEPCSADHCLLTRVVDTRGYVATDFHQHTMLGVDAPTATRDRVISNAAEGVEIAVASEHNVVVDLQPIVRDLRVADWLVSISGDELTTDASRHPWGHANAWPLAYDASKPRGGALLVRDRTAHDLFEALRAQTPRPVLQINHPRTGMTGYFDQYGFDRAKGVGTDAGYDAGFDALEVWNGRNVQSREVVIQDWFALLRTSHAITATADTDTHGIVAQEPGYPRTYVRVTDDEHLGAWDASRTLDLMKGVRERRDVVLTNGPFLKVTANGVGIGGIAKPKAGFVDVNVEVTCAPWIKLDRARVRHARGPTNQSASEITEKPLVMTTVNGATVAKVTLRVFVDRDDAIVVDVSGHEPMTPVMARDSADDAALAPYALTGAIWIDADGDGKSLGR